MTWVCGREDTEEKKIKEEKMLDAVMRRVARVRPFQWPIILFKIVPIYVFFY